MNNTPVTEEFERCVVCNVVTAVPVSLPIDWREYYQIGLGQLCVDCAKKLRKERDKENAISTAQIIREIEICKTKS